MIIDCISDLHGFYPKLKGGDLLIVAGDLTATDTPDEYIYLCGWLLDQNYSKKIFIGGNHDNFLQQIPDFFKVCGYCEYLCDSGTEFQGLKIWGSPWTKRFKGMNPLCMAFTVDTDEELAEKWALIPDDIDILVTHSPAIGIMDHVGLQGENSGSLSLMKKARSLRNLKLFVCGHVHEGHGLITPHDLSETALAFPTRIPTCKSMPYLVNASHVNENYKPVNDPIRVEL